MRTFAAALLLLSTSACGDDDAPAPPDAGPTHAAWERGLPSSEVMGARRGLVPARGIIHLHSPYSHDACDGEPKDATGAVKEDCVAHLRAALCSTRMDYAALTDHDDSMADEDWGGALFLERPGEGDALVLDEQSGKPFASRLRCGDAGAHEVLVYVGGENDLMPVLLDDHPPGTVGERHDAYNANTPEAVAQYRATGGLAWIAHGESKDLPLLRSLGLDGMEIYNLHANIDPDIREEFLGLDGADALMRTIQFADMGPDAPEPDLAILGFLSESAPATSRWKTLLSEGARLSGSAGTDAHENALPILLRDGERADSYRRMIRWFSNVALVTDASDPRAIEAALAAGRFFVAFEVFGTPVGFDFHAQLDDTTVAEMGAELTVAAGVELVATVPAIHALDARLPAPQIELRLLRVDAGGGGSETEVAASSTPGAEVRFRADAAGAYRVEVRLVPRHLAPYLGKLVSEGYADVAYVWVYANPIYVRDPT